MEIKPIEIKRLEKDGLQITWSNGTKNSIQSSVLRQGCPCAVCREKRGDTSHSQPITGKASMLKIIEHTKDEETGLEEIWAVGQYALGLRWQDGHDTGIYTFKYLRELAEGTTPQEKKS